MNLYLFCITFSPLIETATPGLPFGPSAPLDPDGPYNVKLFFM